MLTLRGLEASLVVVHDETDELRAQEVLPVHQRLDHVGALAGVGLVDGQELLTQGGLVTFEGDPSAEEARHRGSGPLAPHNRPAELAKLRRDIPHAPVSLAPIHRH